MVGSETLKMEGSRLGESLGANAGAAIGSTNRMSDGNGYEKIGRYPLV